MSSQYTNPYAPPQAHDYQVNDDGPGDAGAVSEAVMEPLRRTRPWVLFLAIVGFIGTGLMGLFGLFALALGTSTAGAGVPAGMGLVYIVLAGVYVMPSLRMLNYASSIARLVRDPRTERLVVALDHQRSFWKLVGIMTAVVLALYPIAIVAGVVMFASRARF